jgi:peptidoglycan/xylan/chitin deacetylase (PgdA/CDA1 family)
MRPGVVVLAYHRICPKPPTPFDVGVWSATPETLDQQIRLLKRQFNVIGIEELADAVRTGRGRHALLTFDDGYRDNFDHALPVLRANNVRATFFITSGFMDGTASAWWDDIAWILHRTRRWKLEPRSRERLIQEMLTAYKSLSIIETSAFLAELEQIAEMNRPTRADVADLWMTWDQLRAMRRQGMAVGGHTVTHLILSQRSPTDQAREIQQCALRIEQELGEPMRWFSYPRGKLDAFDDSTKQSAHEAGAELAFSYYGGYSRYDRWDSMDVRRIAVDADQSAQQFRAALRMPGVFA